MMCQSTSDGINLNVLHFPFLWLFNHHLVGFANHLGKNLHHMPGTSKEGLNLLFKLFLQIWDTADAVHTYTDLWTMLIHVGGKICPLGAEEHLEIFQNKHLNSNSNDAMAAGIYLPVLLQTLDVQTLLCHSKLPSQEESVQSEIFQLSGVSLESWKLFIHSPPPSSRSSG